MAGIRQAAVLGLGGWGTALALVLRQKGITVSIWGHDGQYAAEVARTRVNRKYLDGVALPEDLVITGALDVLKDAGMVILAVPTQHIRGVLTGLKAAWPAQSPPVVSAAKGIENGTLLTPTGIVAEVIGAQTPVGVLSGPSHAEEVARGLPASVVAASASDGLAEAVQEAFRCERFRVYTSRDVVGVELGGAVKNVIAIAAGMCDGLKLGDNAKSALLTRGLAEMARFGRAQGADPMTLFGLAGMGDLITTCFSPFGRNRSVGRQIGEGRTLEEVLRGMVQVAEGVWTTRSLRDTARRRGVEMPITEAVYAILFEGKPPAAAVRELMTREAGQEQEKSQIPNHKSQ
jgi:glycerol-3-phosphate dehydrogenase (NAD(P)+)